MSSDPLKLKTIRVNNFIHEGHIFSDIKIYFDPEVNEITAESFSQDQDVYFLDDSEIEKLEYHTSHYVWKYNPLYLSVEERIIYESVLRMKAGYMDTVCYLSGKDYCALRNSLGRFYTGKILGARDELTIKVDPELDDEGTLIKWE